MTDTDRPRPLATVLGPVRAPLALAMVLQALASAAGVSKSGLFAHFPSKEALQIELLDRAAVDFRDRGLDGRAIAADGRVWAAGGASEAQEIAGILGSMVHSLRLLVGGGLSLQHSFDAVGLIVDAGPNQLVTMAKLRALRLCHARVVEAFGAAPAAGTCASTR